MRCSLPFSRMWNWLAVRPWMGLPFSVTTTSTRTRFALVRMTGGADGVGAADCCDGGVAWGAQQGASNTAAEMAEQKKRVRRQIIGRPARKRFPGETMMPEKPWRGNDVRGSGRAAATRAMALE